jgi:opacity protein-like surface antigen
MPLSDLRLATAAASTLLLCGSASAQLTVDDLEAFEIEQPTDLQAPYLQASYLQAISDAEPGESRIGTRANDPRVPNWYARGGLLLMFPQDQTFNDIAFFDEPSGSQAGGTNAVGIDQDLTLGWGGGLYAALGYGFRPNGRFNPRIEAEYMLLLADFRDANDDGITWNSIGVNGLVDMRVQENIKLYAGLGGGITYVSFANPPAQDTNTPLIRVGSDDDVALYVQALGGALFRFSDDIDIDLGLRYTLAEADAFDGDVDFNNVVFHVGLLLHLE